MKLHNLQNNPGAKKRRKRLGCGEGSGRGKTSTRGGKGQTARSGSGIRPGFEGGQLPLYRRLPHRGFSNFRFRKDYALVNLSDLEKVEAAEINREVLIAAGIVRKEAGPIKVLGNGQLTKAVTVAAEKFSASAAAKIEAAGGKVVVLESAPSKESESN